MNIITAIVLYILVTMFSESSEPSTRWKVLGIAVGTAILERMGQMVVPGLGGYVIMLVISTAIVALLVHTWIKVPRINLLKIVGLYAAFRVALFIVAIILWNVRAEG